MLREISNDDLWAAARGLAMFRMSIAELDNLIREHDKVVFASWVIAEAARQVRASRVTVRANEREVSHD